jgi:peptide deformylase
MAKLKILTVPNPILRKRAKKVGKIDKKVLKLVQDMFTTLRRQKDPEGVGLAAPQVGKSLRIFVAKIDNKFQVFINPKIVFRSKEEISEKDEEEHQILEGCLSIPKHYGEVARAKRVKIEYTNLKGKEETKEFKDFLARIVQHEYDHLEGILFADRVLEQKGKFYKLTKDEDDHTLLEKTSLPGITERSLF